jgi:hypothetical protein
MMFECIVSSDGQHSSLRALFQAADQMGFRNILLPDPFPETGIYILEWLVGLKNHHLISAGVRQT